MRPQRNGKRLTRRTFVAVASLGAILSACSTARRDRRVSPQISFRKALAGLEGVQSVSDLRALLGPARGERRVNVHDPNDPAYRPAFTRELWLREVFVPSDLPSRIPSEVVVLSYRFAELSGKRAGGGLTVYFDSSGKRLGWSYSPALRPRDDGGAEAWLTDINESR